MTCWTECYECLKKVFVVEEEGEADDVEDEEEEVEEEEVPEPIIGVDCEEDC